jgi:hypothetical protein
MSAAAEPDPPRDPAQYRTRSLMGPSFWAVTAFGVLCVLAGVGVAVLGPRLLPAEPPSRAAPIAPAAPARPVAGAATVVVPPEVLRESVSEIERLNARIETLEAEETRASHAAMAALAATVLVEAARGSRPFTAELEALRAQAPDTPELDALVRLAGLGAPSRAALAVSFPPYAARAVSAGRAPHDDEGLEARISYAISRVISLRRVGDVPGQGVQALIAQAERNIGDGDVDAALKALDQLPVSAREAMAPWRERAERRAEIDRQITALRERALNELTASGPGA